MRPRTSPGSRLDGRPPPGLAAGDVIRTQIVGVGVIENRCRNESGFKHT